MRRVSEAVRGVLGRFSERARQLRFRARSFDALRFRTGVRLNEAKRARHYIASTIILARKVRNAISVPKQRRIFPKTRRFLCVSD